MIYKLYSIDIQYNNPYFIKLFFFLAHTHIYARTRGKIPPNNL